MFNVSDLNKKYEYDYSVKKSLIKILPGKNFDKKDPFQIVSFINECVTANEWPWDNITYFNCKRIEFFIQEKVPSNISTEKEIYLWIVNNWLKPVFPVVDVSLN